jgi:two-component system, OmpR family, response regulator
MARLRALLVEDDARLAALVGEYLDKHEIDVVHLPDGERLVRALKAEPFDVLLLDVMLPGKDGLELCRTVRADTTLGKTPILMLTAKGDDVDRIVGLELGADDYLGKPFNPRELLARIRAVLRRAQPSAPDAEQLRVGEIVLSLGAREARVGARALPLTQFEFELLAVLARSAGRVLSRDYLMETLRGTEFESFDRSIDVHVSRLRQKLGDDPKAPRFIKTVRGVGYVLARD